MDVLQDQRERVLAAIRLARLADRARRRIGPERLVVGAAVVVAGEAEAARRPEDQQRRRERQRARPPARLARARTSCAASRRTAPASRTARGTARTRSGCPGTPPRSRRRRTPPRTTRRQQRLHPPGIAPHGFAEPALLKRDDRQIRLRGDKKREKAEGRREKGRIAFSLAGRLFHRPVTSFRRWRSSRAGRLRRSRSAPAGCIPCWRGPSSRRSPGPPVRSWCPTWAEPASSLVQLLQV